MPLVDTPWFPTRNLRSPAQSYKRAAKFELQSFESGDAEMDELIDLNEKRFTAMALFSDPTPLSSPFHFLL
ncbi:hypothetical protein ACTXT7_004827 [Hymenolepis weldensis]